MMEHNLLYFYKNSLLRDLCSEYNKEWKACKEDREKLMQLALQQQSIPYMATSMYEGWGMSVDFLKREFADYINGKHAFNDVDGMDGYTYSMWVDNHDYITLKEDVSHFVQCDSRISVQETKCPTIYISNKSNVHLELDGFNTIRIYLFDESVLTIDYVDVHSNVVVYMYSPKCEVKVLENDGKVKMFTKDLRL